jgi:hydroxypyruvate reductase
MSRADLERIWRAGVEACLPARVLPPHLPEPPAGRTIVLALGKAAAGMAETLEAHWPWPLEGLAVAPHGTSAALRRLELAHAAHPVPDEASVAAAERLLGFAEGAAADDLVLVLLSGGASALACLPGEGLSLGDKRRLTAALLRSGAAIGEVNCVRRHVSRIKGGRLGAAAAPARLVTLAISDVAGDRPADIGSGPTVADGSTVEDARQVLRGYAIAEPPAGWSESPRQVAGEFRIVAGNADALRAAAEEARRLGYEPVLLGACSGEAREVGRTHAAAALRQRGRKALISGGELTVAVSGSGSGGPNREYALAAAITLAGSSAEGLAADSDGVDWSGEAAGAFFDGTTLARSRRDAAAALAANDSGGFFAASGDALVTGQTGTNVSDLRIILTVKGDSYVTVP